MRMKLPLPLSLLLASCSWGEPEEWVSAEIDGHRTSDFKLFVRDGTIVGGFDSCNKWGRSDSDGLITSELEGFPPDPLDNAYWSLAMGKDTKLAREGAHLSVRNLGHRGTFIKVSEER